MGTMQNLKPPQEEEKESCYLNYILQVNARNCGFQLIFPCYNLVVFATRA